jgi:hypothetical protein
VRPGRTGVIGVMHAHEEHRGSSLGSAPGAPNGFNAAIRRVREQAGAAARRDACRPVTTADVLGPTEKHGGHPARAPADTLLRQRCVIARRPALECAGWLRPSLGFTSGETASKDRPWLIG